MRNKLKIISIIILVVVILHFILTMIRGTRAMFNFSEDWIIWLYFIILIFISIIVLVKSDKIKSWVKGLLVGSILGGGITSLLVLAFALSRLSELISDATVHWMFVQLPIGIIGYPAIIIGAVIGAIVGKRKSKKEL